MFINKGGFKVGKGTYWNLRQGNRIDIVGEGILPGDSKSTYLRMSTGVLLISGPVIGLSYAILMPFIGIAAVAALIGRKAVGGMYNLAAKSVSFGWRPSNAYLSGKKKKDGTK